MTDLEATITCLIMFIIVCTSFADYAALCMSRPPDPMFNPISV